MKTKVLLVDDEKLERVLIRKGYDWEAKGFEIIGEASNGEEALQFLSNKKPDIIITDINMPYMDGLALTERIKEQCPKCRVIIITGYREFEYARRAVKLGVEDFILKPVNISEIAGLVETMKEELEKEADYSQEYSKLKETALQNLDIIKESFLQRLVENHIEEEEATHKIQMYSYEPLLQQCICINIKPYIETDNSDVGSLTLSKKILERIIHNNYSNMVAFVHYLCNIIIYFYGHNLERVADIASQIKKQLNNEFNMDADIGISNECHGFKGISKAYTQTEKAISASVIIGRNSCISYKEYSDIKKKNQNYAEIDWSDFIFHVENCFADQVEEDINDYTESMKLAGIINSDYLKLMAMHMLSKASSVLTKYGKTLGQLIGEEILYKEVSSIKTVEEMNLCLKKLIKSILIFSDSKRTKKSNKLIDLALAYINEHLCESSLTLKTVAKHVYANESYLSRVFKKELEESLIEYITRKRIEYSIELLNTTDLKVYEIAEKIGFGDSHYFSLCFKKQVGVTIKEYKKPKF